jgi:hypothetical protein
MSPLVRIFELKFGSPREISRVRHLIVKSRVSAHPYAIGPSR